VKTNDWYVTLLVKSLVILPEVSNAARTAWAPPFIERIRSSRRMGPRPQIVSSVFRMCSSKPSKLHASSGDAALSASSVRRLGRSSLNGW